MSVGKRPWLLVLNWIVEAALAGVAVKRLRRLNASNHRCFFWGALVLLGGFCVYLVYRSIETSRAYYVPERAKPEALPALLVQSA